jgi:hypothetical protein
MVLETIFHRIFLNIHCIEKLFEAAAINFNDMNVLLLLFCMMNLSWKINWGSLILTSCKSILPFLIVLFYLAVSRGFNLWIYQTIGRTPWTGDRPDARPLPTQDKTTQRNADTHPCPEQDSNLRSQHSSDRRQYLIRPVGYWDRP